MGRPVISKHALLIGIDQYSDPDVESLEGCVNDVSAVAALLKEKYDFDDERTTLLTKPEQTTRKRILDELEELADRVTEQDVVVVYYSGHGSQVPDRDGDEKDKRDETIVPSDSGRGRRDVYDITDDELHSYIAGIARKSQFTSFVFDSCHSGSVDRGALLTADFIVARGDEPRPRAIPPADRVPAEPPRIYGDAIKKSRYEELSRSATGLFAQGDYLMIGACLDQQTAKETQLNGNVRGVLSFYLCDALENASDESVDDVFKSIAKEVEAAVEQQTPVLEGPLRLTRARPFSDVAKRDDAKPDQTGDGGNGGGGSSDNGKDGDGDGDGDKKGNGKEEESTFLEWDGRFAVGAAFVLFLIVGGLVGAIGWFTHWLITSEPSAIDASLLVIISLVVVGLLLASFGAYIAFLEARGRAHALQRLLAAASNVKSRDPNAPNVAGEAVKEVKGIFEALGKMPTARGLVAVGGVALVAATALAWHTIPDLEKDQEPTITVQPAAVTTRAGGKAFFRVRASGEDLSYQWERNGQDIAEEADGRTLLISPAQESENDDRITAVVTNDAGEAISDDVVLTIEKPDKEK